MRTIVILLLVVLLCPVLKAQVGKTDSTAWALQTPGSISEKSLSFINKKYTTLTADVNKKTATLLGDMQKKEAKLQAKLNGADSTKAQQLFAGANTNYQQLQAKLKAPLNRLQTTVNPLKQYIPGLDSISTLMHFLSGNNALPAGKLAQIQGISNQLQQLQGRLQQANEVQGYVQQREQFLKDQLSKYDVSGPLRGINQKVYYYQQQLQQIKSLINDKQQLEEAVFNKVRELPAFQNFMARYSILAQLFPMPGSPTMPSENMLTGLQTREQIQNHLNSKLPTEASGAGTTGSNGIGASGAGATGEGTTGGGGTDPSQYMQQQLEQAQGQLNSLRDKLTQQAGGSSMNGNMTVPDFSPNNQRTRSMLKRLIVGFNLQTEPSTTLLPAIGDIGFSLGYKISDKATIGTGISYKIGLPSGFSRGTFSSEGIGLRSFMDIKAKKSIWITGGYEYNYMQAFSKLSDLRHIDVWQKSALAGVTKKYKVGKKEGNVQLLYDFLYRQEVPQGKPFLFRVGYSF
jgi:hypothetical protein